MKPQSCKAKGRRLQQIVRDKLLLRWPKLTCDDIRSTSMGAGGEDIQLSSQAREFIPFSFECKNQERIDVWGAVKQCRQNAPPNSTPIVVIKRNTETPHAVVPLDTFLDLISSKNELPCSDAPAEQPCRSMQDILREALRLCEAEQIEDRS